MKKLVFLAVLCISASVVVSFFSCSAQAPKANLKTEIDSLSYAYGISFSNGLDEHLLRLGLEEAYKDEFYKGFFEGIKINTEDKKVSAKMMGQSIGMQVANDMFNGASENLFGANSTQSLNKSQYLAGFIAAAQSKDLLMNKDDIEIFVQTKSTVLRAKLNEKLIAENQAFLDENRNKEGVIALPSGLQYKVIKEGDGPKPTIESTVKANYKGMDINGDVFQENEGVDFPLMRVIPGWTEGLQLMPVGSKYILYLPYDLAYGERGDPPHIQPYATLIFEVELLEIVE